MMKNDDKRAAYVSAALEHMLEQGLHDAGLRALAERAGTSDRMLVYYFGSKEALVADALTLLADQLTLALEPSQAGPRLAVEQVEAQLLAQLVQPHFEPAVALYLEVCAQAARGAKPYSTAAKALQQRLLSWIDARLDAPALTRPALQRRALARVSGDLMLRAVEHSASE